jgi:hypothetical protein
MSTLRGGAWRWWYAVGASAAGSVSRTAEDERPHGVHQEGIASFVATDLMTAAGCRSPRPAVVSREVVPPTVGEST